ncbi:NADP-dependent oxidoreductase [Mesorhizobium sp. LHD-90]|uniref:NADP-dependent oxidoreductase n=1 Tax=Mesorhizobium sp. LHD-90 TaxID=3071414 RepID=UPI0027DEB91B|nr:NADP-dependent oxidoreductase [Mesorhizobium sp. LHD-90]MDQ6433911.1 NADP-dependent oxidoreductase [Mesorhizobium sp. LHD-90]
MRAIVQTAIGGPEVLTVSDVPTPRPERGQVLVRLKAAGINPVDVAVRAGFYPLLGEPPFTIGWDIAGTVEAVGEGVTAFKAGDAVFGMPYFPKQAAAYAEYAVAPANELATKPEALDFVPAAGLPLAGLTAWQALVDAGGLKAGDRVLIHAAAGGVGHLAVQIARARGAHVVATASTGKLDFVRSLGADEAIDYTAADFTKKVRDIDIVLEPLGGDHAALSLKTLRPGGIIAALLTPSDSAKAEIDRSGARFARIGVRPDGPSLTELAALAEAGKLKVHVARTFPLAEAGAAHTFLATKPIGKVVLTL